MGRLDGKVAIVTGGGRGIGRGVVLALAKEGASITIAEMDPVSGAAVAEEIKSLGQRALAIQCDVSKRENVKSVVAATLKEFGTVDIMVNVAQVSTQKPFEQHTDEDMAIAFNTGLYGTFYFMQEVFPILKEKGYGKIINFASGAGLRGMESQAGYAAAKEAIRALTRVAGNEWGQYGINVNVVCPAATSPGVEQWKKDFPEAYAERTKAIPLRRWGDPEMDIGRVVVFLASHDSDYITNHTLMVDGGGTLAR